MKSRMDAPLCVAGQETLHMVKFWYLLFYNILERIVFFIVSQNSVALTSRLQLINLC